VLDLGLDAGLLAGCSTAGGRWAGWHATREVKISAAVILVSMVGIVV